MSRTTISKQCRALLKTLFPGPSFYGVDSVWQRRAVVLRRAHRSCKFVESKRLVHTGSHGHRTKWEMEEEAEKLVKAQRRMKDNLRVLLRDIAQPVAVVTSFMPTSESVGSSTGGMTTAQTRHPEDATGNGQHQNGSKYHGATLSSFTSIAMDPYPLVAFALRIPSRMATALSSLSSSASPSSSSTSNDVISFSTLPAHMVINLLSAPQASTAITFSRPDLYPAPFTSTSGSEGVKYTLSEDGLPVLHGVVGALSCRLVGGPIPLYDLDYFGAGAGAKAREPFLGRGEVASELFIARVVRVERVLSLEAESEHEDGEEWERTLPLVYHRRSYTSCHPRPAGKKDKKA